jgi:hypothetical protein
VLLPRTVPRPADGVLTEGVLSAAAPDAAGARTFETLLDVTGEAFLFRVRLTDPLGRSSERTVTGKLQVNLAPDLQDLKLRRILRDLVVRFTSTTTTERPPSGAYRLEIDFVDAASGGIVQLLSAALHEIAEGNLNSLPASQVSTILRSASTPPGQPDEYGAVVKRFFPPGPFPPPPQGDVLVFLTAPDGTSALLQAPLQDET